MSTSQNDDRIGQERAVAYAHEWVAAWNAHDLTRIMSHYAAELEFSSPLILVRHPGFGGTIRDRLTLERYFAQGLASVPNLRFELLEVLRAVRGFVIYYVNARGGHTAEYVELDDQDKATKVIASYSDL
jgi:hypothetical protein